MKGLLLLMSGQVIDTVVNRSDAQLIQDIVKRDESALRCLIVRHGMDIEESLIRRYHTAVDAAEVAEAMNAAAWNVWRFAKQYDPAKGTVAGWFYRIAENALKSHLRGNGRPHGAFDIEPFGFVRRPDDTSNQTAEYIKDLLAIVDSLPALQKAVIESDLAAGGEGADDERLARRRETSVSSVRVSRHKARATIRKKLKQRGHFISDDSEERPSDES